MKKLHFTAAAAAILAAPVAGKPAAPGAPPTLVESFEAALDRHQPEAANKALQQLIVERRSLAGPVRPEPLLSGLFGRMLVLAGNSAEATAYLEYADSPDVPDAQRTSAQLARALALVRLGDPAGALCASGSRARRWPNSRQVTRFTNAFSKKLENHFHALALYFAFSNFVRVQKTLRMSPAMAAGITDKLWSMEDIIAKIDAMPRSPSRAGLARNAPPGSTLRRYRRKFFPVRGGTYAFRKTSGGPGKSGLGGRVSWYVGR